MDLATSPFLPASAFTGLGSALQVLDELTAVVISTRKTCENPGPIKSQIDRETGHTIPPPDEQ